MLYKDEQKLLLEALKEVIGDECLVTEGYIDKNNGEQVPSFLMQHKDLHCGISIEVGPLVGQIEKGEMTIAESVEKICCVLFERKSLMCNLDSVCEEQIFSYENMKDRIIVQLVNTAANQHLFEWAVSFPIDLFNGELSLVYKIDVTDWLDDQTKYGFLTVSKEMLDLWGVTLGTLTSDGIRNTQKRFPERLNKLDTIMVVVTNQDFYKGAATLLYPGVIESLSQYFNGAFALIPSSIHEFSAIPAELADDNILEIDKVNQNLLKPDEVLGDHVFVFSGEEVFTWES